MSVESLIDQYGKTVTIKRPTIALDTTGNPTASSYATTSATGYLQVGSGATGVLWGGERARYSAVCYFKTGTDIVESDMVTASIDSQTRTFRVESKVIRDDRPSGDPLRYITVALQEELPRT
jgi:hypothetical protein